jgi:hypothetical protein
MTASPPVIAQQYSFATVVPLRFHSRNETFSARFQNVFLDFLTSKELPNLKLR